MIIGVEVGAETGVETGVDAGAANKGKGERVVRTSAAVPIQETTLIFICWRNREVMMPRAETKNCFVEASAERRLGVGGKESTFLGSLPVSKTGRPF